MSAHMRKPLIKVSVGREHFSLPQKEARAVLAIVKSIDSLSTVKNKTAEVVYREVAKGRPQGAVYLRGIRIRENISQKQLEKMTGIPASNISKYESGVRVITKSVAKKFADVLSISSKKLLEI